MKAVKSVTASAKEKVQNVVAKADEKFETNQASVTEKAEKHLAHGKAEEHDAKAKKHVKEAEALREYEQKRAIHAAEKEQKKGALHQTQAEKHNLAEASLNEKLGGQTPSSYAPAPASTPYASAQGNTTPPTSTNAGAPPVQSNLHPSQEQYAPAPAPAVNTPSAVGNIFNSNSVPTGPASTNTTGVPLHGSGVPTSSDLHQDEHNAHTTRVMGGTPNTGTYM